MFSRFVVLSVAACVAAPSSGSLFAAEKEKGEAAAVITYPKEGGKVVRLDQVDGGLAGKKGWMKWFVLSIFIER